MKQKGLFGLLLATAIIYVLYAFVDCFYKLGILLVGDAYYDRMAVENVLGTSTKFMHWFYAIVLLAACVLFMIYNGKKALALIGGIAMIVQSIISLAWSTAVPMLIRSYHFDIVFDYGPWIGGANGLIYSIAIIMIALYYKDPLMEALAAIVTFCQIGVFPLLNIFAKYRVLEGSEYGTANLVVVIPMCILVCIYMFRWAKMSKN